MAVSTHTITQAKIVLYTGSTWQYDLHLTHQDLQSPAQLLPLLHLAAEELDDYQKHQPQTGAKTLHINIISLPVTGSKSLTKCAYKSAVHVQ